MRKSGEGVTPPLPSLTTHPPVHFLPLPRGRKTSLTALCAYRGGRKEALGKEVPRGVCPRRRPDHAATAPNWGVLRGEGSGGSPSGR